MHIQMAGIRNINDAIICTKNGVDIIGLLVGQVHNSDDFISVENYIKKTLLKCFTQKC